ncbi:hypothetical protein M404DRAFT_114703, partial [Pisolithus tinctorius Marx 270]
WTPQDLNLYIVQRNIEFLLAALKIQGYQVIYINAANAVHYYNSHIASVFTLAHNNCKINIVISSSTTAISPIFHYHSTALMNFISHDSVFCAYPELTLHKHSYMDPFIIFSQALKCLTMEAFVKYHDRG